MTEIRVDFNNRTRDGHVRGSLRRAGEVSEGQIVRLIDPDEEMDFRARVAAVDELNGRVVYEVEWTDARAISGPSTNGDYRPPTVSLYGWIASRGDFRRLSNPFGAPQTQGGQPAHV